MQSKNEEFVALMKAAGWSQAETARRLHASLAAVSQFVNGHAVPARSTLSLLKLLLVRSQRDGIKVKEEPSAGLPAWASDRISDLEAIPEGRRKGLVFSFRQIAKLNQPPKNSKTDQEAAQMDC